MNKVYMAIKIRDKKSIALPKEYTKILKYTKNRHKKRLVIKDFNAETC